MSDAELNEKLKARGMFTLDQMMDDAVSGLGPFDTQAGLKTFDHLCQWVDQQRRQFTTMRMRYEVGELDKEDDMYEWVFTHCAAFTLISKHVRKVNAASEITALRAELERLREVANDCARAYDFFDKVSGSSEDEKITVGTDHYDWVIRSCYNARRYLGSPSLNETDEHA
jgi:hypothetical protein